VKLSQHASDQKRTYRGLPRPYMDQWHRLDSTVALNVLSGIGRCPFSWPLLSSEVVEGHTLPTDTHDELDGRRSFDQELQEHLSTGTVHRIKQHLQDALVLHLVSGRSKKAMRYSWLLMLLLSYVAFPCGRGLVECPGCCWDIFHSLCSLIAE
jgi:hypothetical protein